MSSTTNVSLNDDDYNNYNDNQEIDSRQSLVSKKTLMEKHEVIQKISSKDNKEEEKMEPKKSIDEVDDTYNIKNFVLH